MSAESTISIASLGLEPLISLAHEDWHIPKFKNPLLVPVYNSMRANSSRVRLLLLLPSTISGFTKRVQRFLDIAEFQVTGTLDNSTEVANEQIMARFHEVFGADVMQGQELKGTPAWDENVLKYHHDALQLVDGMAQNPIGLLTFMPLFAAHLTTMWTTLEALFGDLWEAAVNAHPEKLAALKGNRSRINRLHSGAKTKDFQASETKSVPLDWIENHRFEIKSKMGTMLRQRFEFTKLASIREAYSCAFCEKSGKIDQALGNKSLDALSAMRNVLIHKAGKADAEYVKRCEYLPTLPKTSITKSILLNGHIITGLIKPSLESAKNLMTAVDDWIAEN